MLTRALRRRNRDILHSVDRWIDDEVWRASRYGYGCPPEAYPHLNRPVNLEPTYTDVIVAVAARVPQPVRYLELGVSVGKNLCVVAHALQGAVVVGMDWERINPRLAQEFARGGREVRKGGAEPGHHFMVGETTVSYVEVGLDHDAIFDRHRAFARAWSELRGRLRRRIARLRARARRAMGRRGGEAAAEMTRPSTTLLSFATPNFAASQKRLEDKSLEHGIDRVESLGPGDIESGYRRRMAAILDQERGAGFWLWKPYLIDRRLAALRDGDFLIYCDAGAHPVARLDPLLDLCTEWGGVCLFQNLDRTNRAWTRRDCYILMDADRPEIQEAPQIDAAFIVLRKTALAVAVVKEWLAACEDARILTGAPSELGPELPGFQDHRHDQSVLSIIAARRGLTLARCPSQFGSGFTRPERGWDFPTLFHHHRGRRRRLTIRRVLRAIARRLESGGGTLIRFARDRYSQNGEDGILAEIFRRLGIAEGSFVEFGAWDGKHLSNTHALLEEGWRGVGIEGDAQRYAALRGTAAASGGRLVGIQTYVDSEGASSLDALLRSTDLPADFDLLSIDIDGMDWHIWKSLRHYTPKVVVIEIDRTFPPGVEHVPVPGPAGAAADSPSFTSMLKLGRQKGYTLVCHTGNMIFVRDEFVAQLALPSTELARPHDLFLWRWRWLARGPERSPLRWIGAAIRRRFV